MAHGTVIIPTYNNSVILARTLAVLWQQVLPAGWTMEVIISDDGSTDATLSQVHQVTPPAGWRLHVFSGTHSGAAVARNRALARATGTVVILLQADIELRPGALQAHLQFHQDHPDATAAALGFITWDPRLPPSRLMLWMMHGGHHNNFDALLGRLTADPQHFFYGAFVSVKRELLTLEKFSEEFTGYGWEDLELGRRLERHGMVLHVLHAAQALHVHHYSVADICRRQLATGKNLPTYQRLQPGLVIAPTPSYFQRLKHTLAFYLGVPAVLQQLVTMSERYWVTPRLFGWLTAVYFWQGWYAAKSRK